MDSPNPNEGTGAPASSDELAPTLIENNNAGQEGAVAEAGGSNCPDHDVVTIYAIPELSAFSTTSTCENEIILPTTHALLRRRRVTATTSDAFGDNSRRLCGVSSQCSTLSLSDIASNDDAFFSANSSTNQFFGRNDSDLNVEAHDGYSALTALNANSEILAEMDTGMLSPLEYSKGGIDAIIGAYFAQRPDATESTTNTRSVSTTMEGIFGEECSPSYNTRLGLFPGAAPPFRNNELYPLSAIERYFLAQNFDNLLGLLAKVEDTNRLRVAFNAMKVKLSLPSDHPKGSPKELSDRQMTKVGDIGRKILVSNTNPQQQFYRLSTMRHILDKYDRHAKVLNWAQLGLGITSFNLLKSDLEQVTCPAVAVLEFHDLKVDVVSYIEKWVEKAIMHDLTGGIEDDNDNELPGSSSGARAMSEPDLWAIVREGAELRI